MTESAIHTKYSSPSPQSDETANHSNCPTSSGRARRWGLVGVGGLFTAGLGLGLWGLIPLSLVLFGALFLACPLMHLLGGHQH